ncbi:MAG: hypothetical protein NTZ72_04060, partial [Afipia sp.]|nr:hypothetical protein [Afipia sp.]
SKGEATMKKMVLSGLIVLASAGVASAQLYGNSNRGSSFGGGFGTGSNSSSHSTQGYNTNSGTYVPPAHATNPNNTQMDNYTTRGNVNPYTGAVGTRAPRY